MEGKITINEEEMKGMVEVWIKSKLGEIKIDEIKNKGYGSMDTEVYFSDPEEKEGKTDDSLF